MNVNFGQLRAPCKIFNRWIFCGALVSGLQLWSTGGAVGAFQAEPSSGPRAMGTPPSLSSTSFSSQSLKSFSSMKLARLLHCSTSFSSSSFPLLPFIILINKPPSMCSNHSHHCHSHHLIFHCQNQLYQSHLHCPTSFSSPLLP